MSQSVSSLDTPETAKAATPDVSLHPTLREQFVRLSVSIGWVSAFLHFWPKDRWPGLALWFYATPWGVILGAAFIATIGSLLLKYRTRSPRVFYGSAALLFLSGGMWLATDWNWRSVPAASVTEEHGEASPIRLLVWNASRGRSGWNNVVAEIRRYDPDVICLVESGRHSEEMRSLWESSFPDCEVSMLGGGIVCIVRGTAGECEPVELTRDSRLRILPVEVKGQSFLCAIVDVESTIFKVRELPLTRLPESLSHLSGPVVVAGDFNTPSDSVHFARLSERFTSVFDNVGAGYGATWPVPVPLMALDQVWHNDGILPLSHTLGWSRVSDHRPVIVEFTVAE